MVNSDNIILILYEIVLSIIINLALMFQVLLIKGSIISTLLTDKRRGRGELGMATDFIFKSISIFTNPK